MHMTVEPKRIWSDHFHNFRIQLIDRCHHERDLVLKKKKKTLDNNNYV